MRDLGAENRSCTFGTGRLIMPGLRGLIIPAQSDESLADIMQTETAVRLLNLGASLYLLNNGTSVLAITKPAGAFAKAWGMGGRGLAVAA
jgi:hypothetical protein